MTVILAIFIARLLDLIAGAVALLGGFAAKRPWQILLAALVATSLAELIIAWLRLTYRFSLLAFLIGILAMAVWASAGWFLHRLARNTEV